MLKITIEVPEEEEVEKTIEKFPKNAKPWACG